MSKPNDPNRDELKDRLLDQGLHETLGIEQPPNLTDKILAAAENQNTASPKRKDRTMKKLTTSISWVVGIATCLLVVIGLLVPATQMARHSTRRLQSERARQLGLAQHNYQDVYRFTPGGRGAGMGGDQYDHIVENVFLA